MQTSASDHEPHDLADRLSGISTHWSLVFQAHQTKAASQTDAAQTALLERYCGAVYRYILAALRDVDATDEVAQEFAYCFARGDFKRADPHRGRFRDFVRTVVFHQIVNYQRKQGRRRHWERPAEDLAEKVGAAEQVEDDAEFTQLWREEILQRGWEALAKEEQSGQAPYYQVLRLRAEHPRATSEQLAENLSARTDRPFTAAGVRQLLKRSRVRFAEGLIDETARSLQTTRMEDVEQELIDLGLMSYCKQVWVGWREQSRREGGGEGSPE